MFAKTNIRYITSRVAVGIMIKYPQTVVKNVHIISHIASIELVGSHFSGDKNFVCDSPCFAAGALTRHSWAMYK